MKMKRQLTPAEKIAIAHEYESGDVSMDSLSKKYGVSKSTISRTIKSKKQKTPSSSPSRKTQIQVHNEMLEYIEAAGDEFREISMDENKRLLVDAFVNLPPIIRHELLEIIEAHESGNVIRLKTKE